MGGLRRAVAIALAAVVPLLALSACGAGGGRAIPLERAAGADDGAASGAGGAAPAPAQAETELHPAPPPPPTTTPPAPTTSPPAPAPPSPAAPVAAAAGVAAVGDGAFTLAPYSGLGAWIDVYDWSMTFARGLPEPAVGPADIDRMASLGVQTLYVQASKWDAPTDVLEPERLLPLIARARSHGMAVVAWYLPTLEDVGADLRRLLAIAALEIDGLAVDIEATNVADPAERTRRIITLSSYLRASLPGQVIGAIPLDPVTIEVINPRYWPGFPWAELAPLYDIWMPMAYWTFRKQSSGYRDGYRYTAENIDRVRANLGNPQAPVHALGGIGDETSPEQVAGMLRAAAERRAVGGSLYDYRTTHDALWEPLQGFRAPR